MGWLIEGPWSTRDGVRWAAEASDLQDMLPNGNLLETVIWTKHLDGEGDVTHWTGCDGQYEYTVFND